MYIKMDSSEVQCENMDWIQLIQVNVQLSFVNTDKFFGYIKMWHFLTIWININFLIKIL